MTSVITFDTLIANVNRPRIRDYTALLGEDSRILSWIDFEAARTTVVGSRLSASTDRGPAGNDLAQATDSKRADLITGPSGRPAVAFDHDVAAEVYLLSGLLPVGGGTSWTKAVLIRPTDLPSGNTYMLAGLTGAGRHLFQLQGPNRLVHRVGSSGAEATVRYDDYVGGEWVLVLATWEQDVDGTGGTVGLSINGGPFETVYESSAVFSDTALGVGGLASGGQGATFDLAGLMLCNTSLRLTANADLLDNVRGWFGDRYQLALG